MAGGQHKLSRRALLAGACGVPLVPSLSHAGLDPASIFLPAVREGRWIPDQVRDDDVVRGAVWERVLALYRRAELGLEAVGRTEDDDVYDRALGRHHRALSRLLRTAAPDLGAVGVKVDLILRHQVFELSFGEAALEALRGDVWGFAGRG